MKIISPKEDHHISSRNLFSFTANQVVRIMEKLIEIVEQKFF